ncbi:response regulator [Pseudomonas carassii]|uniref:Response regulator n=1 Tax=Pseudomonas carassii TaxID=3115855 RepID=A0ABU7H9X6_9PSED|nr:response regulator [Pseudomonas sp. 137P]MEE1888093.1 response regulator [Pseudomonas sp. 137P]
MDKNMRILIVENSYTMRTILKRTLGDLGFTNVSEAENGTATLSRLGSESFDFLIAVDPLRDMFGADLLLKLRADERLKKLPALMVLAEPKQSLIGEDLIAGANDYVIKPVSATELQEKIEKIFNSSKT